MDMSVDHPGQDQQTGCVERRPRDVEVADGDDPSTGDGQVCPMSAFGCHDVATLDDQVGRRLDRLRWCYLRPLPGINDGALQDGLFGWPAARAIPS
jgi:hypothetical protein